MEVDDRVWTPAELLERYNQGERDFRGLEISDERENSGTFRDALLDGADFSHSFVDADFGGARLRNSKFVQANVKTCRFDGADLSNADFSGAAICSATFSSSNFQGAQFEGASVHGYAFGKGELPD
jgi:2-iminobutanoate/2-iminopropanoate deaminase